MLSWWRRNRFSASSRRGDLKRSITNIASECRIANIVRDHAMILVDDATPKPDEIFGKDRLIGSIRRDCLDHVVVFGERHLRHLLNSYQKYYNEARTHLTAQGRADPAGRSDCRAHAGDASSGRTPP